MNIQMIGIDHSIASVEYREIFAFTKADQQVAMQKIRKMSGIRGCVMLSTCNRMELYVSTQEGVCVDLYEILCVLKQVPKGAFQQYFVTRTGEVAVRHLFVLAAGMESRIIGEDQILMQVKEALAWARECETTDKVLEVFFRMAVTAGKKVKTQIHFSRGNASAIHQAMDQLRQRGCDFAGMKCMVIGNGEMGKLTAMQLKEAGADVTVTVRQYRSGVVQIPPGCRRIHYGERYEHLASCALIVSATASPNLTLTKEEVEKQHLELDPLREQMIFLDLAVPRDIDPRIGEIPGAIVYDIDDFSIDRESEELKSQLEEASEMITEGVEEFISWYDCRTFVPMIQKISQEAAKDAGWRMGQTFQKMELTPQEQSTIASATQTVTAKVVAKLMFELRDSVSPEHLRECLEAFAHAYPEADDEE